MVASSMPAMMRSSEDLPRPFAATRPRRSPLATEKLSPANRDWLRVSEEILYGDQRHGSLVGQGYRKG